MSGIFKAVHIPGYQLRDNSYVAFKIEITTQHTTWTVYHRFSDFINLHYHIKDKYNVPDPPAKKTFGKTSDELSKARRAKLEEYVQTLLLENDNSVVENPEINEFFALEGKLQNRKASRAMKWVEDCNRMNVIINEIALKLGERRKYKDQGVDAHQLSTEIRQKIRNLTTDINELSETLDIIEKTGSADITDAELLRRQNMLQTLRGKLEDLEKREKEEPGNRTSQRNKLLGGGASGSGRVWGQETAETKDKDKKELIQYQRDVMTQQDEGLERLGEIISKQKNIAYQIGNELDEQNRMLDNLGNKMDNTNVRLGYTTKRVMKQL